MGAMRLPAPLRDAAMFARSIKQGGSFAARDNLVTVRPSPQTAVDAVPDGWASRLPPPLENVRAGDATLFEDPRITWAFETLGGVKDMNIVELGPLEGAHSYMAQVAGAANVIGVEANKTAFLKCLVTKELLGLDRCRFECGDVIEYLDQDARDDFDVCIACGILYHMTEPVRLIDLIGQRAKRVVIWTHIYDESAGGQFAARFAAPEEVTYKDFRHRVYRQSYGVARQLSGFWGGVQPYSHWLPREDLLRALEHFGWKDIQISFDETHHQNGPSLAFVATRG